MREKTPKTTANHLNAVAAIVRWGYMEGHLLNNCFDRIRLSPKRRGQAKSSRRGFTDDEARLILADARTRRGYRRWVPWLAHFTGARLSELCQLEKADVRYAGAIPYIAIEGEKAGRAKKADKDDGTRGAEAPEAESDKVAINGKNAAKKSLKTDNARRNVPIHPALIAEGFLAFVFERGDGPLFAEITPDRFGSRGGNATKVLSRHLRNELKITDEDVASSHSFRHRFVTLCRRAEVDAERRNALVGHSNHHISDDYGEEHRVRELLNALRKIPVPKGL